MTTTGGRRTVIGASVDRVDGRAKVTGAARYPGDVRMGDLAFASLVRSTIGAGRIRSIDDAAARAGAGVLAIITHENAPVLHRGKRGLITPPPEPPLQGPDIEYYGQYVAVVVADTPQRAAAAARLVNVDCEVRTDAPLRASDPGAKVHDNPYHIDMKRGDVDDGFAASTVVIESTFTTSEQAHSPIGLFATVAFWEGSRLTVHDSTQNPSHVKEILAATFKLKAEDVRVLAPYVGGAFGAGLRVNPHTILAALAARVVDRPVKLVLTRPEMFTGLGHRPSTEQTIRIGAARDGKLLAIDHASSSTASLGNDPLYPIPSGTVSAYACPNVAIRDRRIQFHMPPAAHMRAPGEAEGNFALESSMDELAYGLSMDPIALRLRNYAEVHPQTGGAWSSKALRECYAVGAERFGWASRSPEVGSMRDGRWLVGWGMAGVTYGHFQVDCEARATIRRDGTAFVCSATAEIGVGTWTVMTQVSAEELGLPIVDVEFGLGDTAMPASALVGGSGHTVALGTAIHDASRHLIGAFIELATKDDGSPLAGCSVDDVRVADGRISRSDDPARGERYVDILRRNGLDELTAHGKSKPPRGEMGVQVKSLIVSYHGRVGQRLVGMSKGAVPAGAFGARFVEVRIDPDLGLLRVARVVSAIDAGRVLNEKTARSQIIGGTIQGIGTAMFEEIVTNAETGRIANGTFGDYLVPVNADVPDMDVVFVGEPDPHNPLGVKGVGEVGYVGVPAAIANAIFHATGRRLRSTPITIDQLLQERPHESRRRAAPHNVKEGTISDRQDGPDTIVLVHGLWLTPRSWERWKERYEQAGFRVLAPAWPGMEAEVEALNADPSPIANLTVERIVDHYESIIIDLERPPIIMGHSFGGTFTQILLDRGLGAAGVGVASATVKGVRDLPLSTIKVAGPALSPSNKGEPVPLTSKEFHYAFANTLSQEASDVMYGRYHVPAASTVLREYAFANFRRDAPTAVTFDRDDRAPLLFIGFGEDHVMPPKVVGHNEAKYDDSASVTEYVEFPGRPHFPAVPGWEEVADHALRWAVEHSVAADRVLDS